MTTRRRSSSSRRTSTSGRSRRTTSRSPSRTRRTTPTTRRRQARPATTFGAAVGTVFVAFVLGAPWSVRIALIVLVVAGAVGYLIWTRRR